MNYGKEPFVLGESDFEPTPDELLEIKIQTGREPMEKSRSGQEEVRRIIEMLEKKKGKKSALSMLLSKDTEGLLSDLMSIIGDDPLGVVAAQTTDPSKKALYQGKDRMRMPKDMPEFLDFKKKGGM